MDNIVRKKLIIIVSVVILLITTVLLVLWLLFGQKNTNNHSFYTDPYTGEVVDNKRTGGGSPNPDANDIIFLGLGRLLSYGISNQQLNRFKDYIYQYSKKRVKNNESKITEVTVDFSTYKQKIGTNSTGSEFTIILNRDENLKYNIVNTYPTVSTIATKIYKGDLKVFDSTLIKFDNNEHPV